MIQLSKERLAEYKKELDRTIYTDADEINIYAQFRLDGMAEVGAIEMLNSFGIKELKAIARFRRLYSHYFPNKQAELVKELDDTHKEWVNSQEEIGHLGATVRDLKDQNKRYRKMYEYLKSSGQCIYVDHEKCQDAISLRDYKDMMSDLNAIVEGEE